MKVELEHASCPGTQQVALVIVPETTLEWQLLYHLIPDPRTQEAKAVVRCFVGENPTECEQCGQGGSVARIEIWKEG